MFGPRGLICQSCGMPLAKDPLGGGLETDGSKSSKWCSYCWRDGVFVSPDMSLPEMITLVEGKLREMHIPGPLAKQMAKGTSELERWRARALV